MPHAGDIQDLTTEADAEITWLVRDGDARGDPLALDAVRAAELPARRAPVRLDRGRVRRVKELRRHLVRERGIDRRRVTFVGYWRQGLSEEQLREQAVTADSDARTGDRTLPLHGTEVHGSR